MRYYALVFFLVISLAVGSNCQEDENSDDVFDKPIDRAPLKMVEMPREEIVNEGMDSFETSTEMIEIPTNDSSLEVGPIQKTSVFSPVTQLDGGLFNFSRATIEMDSDEDSEEESKEQSTTSTPLEVITFASLPIEKIDEVADRRVLKEKELPTPAKVPSTTTESVSAVSDPSEEDEPFDQSAFDGIFEQDGSVIDASLSTDKAPAFPILKMKEEDAKILSSSGSTETSTSSMSSEPSSTETETTSTTTTTSTSTMSATSTEEMTTTSEESTTSSEEPSTTTLEVIRNSSKVFLPAKSIRTPISLRIISLEFSDEFNDIQSGPSRKLAKELAPSIASLISSIAGEDNLVSVDIKTLKKGSVIVEADVLTKKSLGDAQMAVNLLEAAVSRNNSMLADYTVDSLSVTVDGMTSQAYIDSISTQSSSAYSLSSLMIVIITFALVIIFAVALFIIMMTTKRRRQSTMKLSMDDTIRSITPESNDTPHNVHLMSYGTTPRASSTSQKPGAITKTQIDETASPMY